MNSNKNGHRAKYFMLFVKDSGVSSEDILKYIDENIDIINEMGVKIKITLLSDADLSVDTVNRLANQGILRFPALVTEDGKVRLGVKKIQTLFDDNKKSYRQYLMQPVASKKQSNTAPAVFDSAEEQSLAEFYGNEMTRDAIERDKNVAREAEGFEGGASDDFNRRVSDQLSRRKIGATMPIDAEAMMVARQQPEGKRPESTKRQKDQQAQTPDQLHPERDNIATSPVIKKSSAALPPPTPSNGQFDDSIFDRVFTQGLGSEY